MAAAGACTVGGITETDPVGASETVADVDAARAAFVVGTIAAYPGRSALYVCSRHSAGLASVFPLLCENEYLLAFFKVISHEGLHLDDNPKDHDACSMMWGGKKID